MLEAAPEDPGHRATGYVVFCLAPSFICCSVRQRTATDNNRLIEPAFSVLQASSMVHSSEVVMKMTPRLACREGIEPRQCE